MGHCDPGGGAGVSQVVLVDLPVSGPDHQPSTVQSEVHSCQRTVHADGPQDAGDADEHAVKHKVEQILSTDKEWASAHAAFLLMLCFGSGLLDRKFYINTG